MVLFTSTVGFHSDLRMARAMKEQKPDLKIAFVGPHVQIKPAESLLASPDIDFVVRGEFDHAVVEYAQGKPLSEIANASYVKDGKIVHNPSRPLLQTAELDELPFATDVYQQRSDDRELQRAFPAASVRFLLYFSRMSGSLHVLPVAADAFRPCLARALGRKRGARIPAGAQDVSAGEGILLRRRHVQYPQRPRLALCKEFKPVGFQWSCTARVHGDYETLKAMADAGCRLLIVGFESGDAQILKNIKKGETVEMGRNFVKNCKKVGIHVHGDFIIGLPGETKETIEKTINFAKELDCETIQVSHGARISRNGALRPGHARRVSGRRSDHRRGRAPASAPPVSRICRRNTWWTP